MLTKDKFERFKNDYSVYKRTTITDKYGNTKDAISADPAGTIHVMWHPVTDEAAVVEYGERVSKMLEAVFYDGDAAEFDVIKIGGISYEVRSVLPYNTHRLIRVERI